MIKIHVLYEHSGDKIPHGSSYLRLLNPLKHKSLQNLIHVSQGDMYENVETDVIIIDRYWKPDIDLDEAAKVVKYIKLKKMSFIYSIDDNLLDLNNYDLNLNNKNLNLKNIVRYFIREADAVIVSTKVLRKRVLNLNPNVYYIENCLDESLLLSDEGLLRRKVKSCDEKLVIGYMGTPTHERDFYMILTAINNILNKYKNKVRLEFVGAVADGQITKYLKNSKCLDVGNNVEYPKFWNWMNKSISWDIGIAPLEEDAFTVCKSDIKFLDYSALGISGIYSNLVPYNNTVVHNVTGLLADNTIKSWEGCIEELIINNDLRKSICENSREYLMNNRVLDKKSALWEIVIREVYNKNLN